METRDTNALKQASFYWHAEEAISVMPKPASHSLFLVSWALRCLEANFPLAHSPYFREQGSTQL